MADKKMPTTAAPPEDKTNPKAKGKKKDEHRDSMREIWETVVFVVVLVLMLKTFVAEAFVIPTGSMAETLYGYQRMVVCDQCDYKFPVNCSSEVDPQRGNARSEITGCICPNCANPIHWTASTAPSWSSGDRVLVAKFLYDRDMLWHPRRHQIIVFKYPQEPQQGTTAMNYIKRCEGESEETIAVFDGDLYVTKFLKYPHLTPSEDPLDRWKRENMYENDEDALKYFVKSMNNRVEGRANEDDFQIIRKPPDVMLAMRRIVFDNDYQPRDLTKVGIHRWQLPEGGRWAGNDPERPLVFKHAPNASEGSMAWMTYAHLLGELHRKRNADPLRLLNVPDEFHQHGDRRLITNFMGYNSGDGDPNRDTTGRYWVSDLMLDLEVKVDSEEGTVVLELSKGYDRFRAVFNVASGECVLQRLTGATDAEREKNTKELGRAGTSLKHKGTYHVRFANFDERLTVWVDRKLPFGEGVVYAPARDRGPVKDNDLEAPARVGASGAAVSVSHLQLWRDTCYTQAEDPNGMPRFQSRAVLGQQHYVLTMYVQPGCYLCLGDNSASSSDSRYWGLVPERLLLGRALVVYFPFWPFNHRAGLIR